MLRALLELVGFLRCSSLPTLLMLPDLLLVGICVVLISVIAAQALGTLDPYASARTRWAQRLVPPIVVLLADVYTFGVAVPSMHAHWLPAVIGYAAIGVMLLVPLHLWRAIRVRSRGALEGISRPAWRRAGMARQLPWLAVVVSIQACRPSDGQSVRSAVPGVAVVAAPCAQTIATQVQVDAPAGWATAVEDSSARLVSVQVWDGPPGTQPAVLPTLHRFADSAQVATWVLGAPVRGEHWVTCAYERLPFSLARPVAPLIRAITVTSDLRVQVAGQPVITAITFQ